MALSGKIYTAAYMFNGAPWYVAFHWTAAQSRENNASSVSWALVAETASTSKVIISELAVSFDGIAVYQRSQSVHTTSKNGTVLASGTQYIPHNADGTKSVAVSIGAGIYNWAINVKGNGILALDQIPRYVTILSAPNFHDEENPTITYSNAVGETVTSLQACISLDGENGDVPYRDIQTDDSSYTFVLTEAERDILRENTSANSRTVVFCIKTVLDGITYYSKLPKTFSIKDPNPILTPVITDGNSITVALTGDSGKLIRYASNAQVTIGASAVKRAEITAQTASNAGKSIAADGVFETVESGSFRFTATDSRGNTTVKEVALPFVEYEKPTCMIENTKPNADGEMTVKAEGTFFNGSFGARSNSLTVLYRYKVLGGEYGSWTEMAVALDGNRYTAQALATGLDYQLTNVFQICATDELYPAFSAENPVRTFPIFDWSDKDFGFKVPVSVQGDPIADFVTETGTDGHWHWSKWKSGKAECYGTKVYGNVVISTAWGGVFGSQPFAEQFPAELFADTPFFSSVNMVAGDGTAWISYRNGALSKIATQTFEFNRGTAHSLNDVSVSFYAVGRWKT